MKLIKVHQTVYVVKEAIPENIIINEVDISSINFDLLKAIVKPRKRDPELCENYTLKKYQLEAINNLLEKKINVELDMYFYVLAREGEYDWDEVNIWRGEV